MQELMYAFIIFIFYSFIGWLIETSISSLPSKKFVNRGFLIGPYCPIYGIGCLTLIYLLRNYHDDIIALFVIGTAVCSILEYITSFALEKIFGARWWDYSHIPFNVNGRICLVYSILFGIGGVFVSSFNSILIDAISNFPTIIVAIVTLIVFILFIIDVILSFNIINKLKLTTLELRKDNTEEITIKINKILKEKSKKFKRLLQAFPDATIFNKQNPKD